MVWTARIGASCGTGLGREVAHVCFAAVVLVALVLVAVDGHVSRLVVAGGALFFVSRRFRRQS